MILLPLRQQNPDEYLLNFAAGKRI